MERRTRLGASVVAIITAAVVLPASSAVLPISGPFGGEPKPESTVAPGEIALVAFDSCGEALDEFQGAALEQVGPYGLPGGPRMIMVDGLESAMASDAPSGVAARAPSAGAPSSPANHSATNVHESGADEPDLVKTDGRRIVTVAAGTLRVVDAASRTLTASIKLPGGDGAYASGLLLHGDRALVMMPGFGPARPAARTMPHHGHDGARLVLVELSGAGKIAGTLAVDGAYVDARKSGPIARVVIRSGPRLEFRMADEPESPAAATAKNRAIIRGSSIADWLPGFELNTPRGSTSGRLVGCGAVSHPPQDTGVSLLTVLTFDLGRELGTGDPVAITAAGGTVYGTGNSLYVADDGVPFDAMPADRQGRESEAKQRTRVYQFDTAGPGKPRYVASGAVSGSLLNQYSLSEHDGVLRIATTEHDRRCCAEDQQAPESESAVSVLAKRGDKLVPIGSVGGLGKGERIYSVRFLGDVAYVVTFRETDPLYRLDLSDPERPRVTGELKITGYSAYLHPVADDRLLGVGQEATGRGRTTGTQVSLFDISDANEPRRIAQHHVAEAHSEAENDPHAFLFWPAKRLLVMPVMYYSQDAGGESYALVLRVDGDTLTEVGKVSHAVSASDPWQHGVRRSLVVGDTLWTVSEAGVMASDIDTLTRQAWLPFG